MVNLVEAVVVSLLLRVVEGLAVNHLKVDHHNRVALLFLEDRLSRLAQDSYHLAQVNRRLVRDNRHSARGNHHLVRDNRCLAQGNRRLAQGNHRSARVNLLLREQDNQVNRSLEQVSR
ncbi:MAG: hypothetical protein HZB77_01760, partial [Chloroflexi bacterium]|nr:hypothetical protein [Chloroflexota bacterium]